MSTMKYALAADLQIQVEPNKGYALILEGGMIADLVRELNTQMVRRMPRPQQVQRLRGATKAFSFHWSNAQAAWDVMTLKGSDLPWGLDGAEFIVFVGPKALSPVGKLWTLTEMQYVAKQLNPHPGYASSFESGRRGLRAVERVAMRYLVREGRA